MSELSYSDVVRILGVIDRAEDVDIELQTGALSLKVTRAGAGAAPKPAAPVKPVTTAPEPAAAPAAAVASGVADSAAKMAEFPDATPIRAPMSGMFYASPAPGKPAFVEVGQAVSAGDQLGIVEVMKLFTPLTSEMDGTVVAVFVDNQQTVNKDDVLMLISAG
ncbi:acetyl-CoA carboxylase biotin carboxyl carrier protein [Roseovarius indicus]|uniref:acetyl-CoA carboxylase biotin carboxyl carrier protein n=1 Tax=Roseovarius indicus TaxID=540747 RepID=UPI0032ECDA9F